MTVVDHRPVAATSVTQAFASWSSAVSVRSVPASVVARAKLLCADTAAIMVRARNDAESTPPLLEALAALGLTNGACHALGDAQGYAASGAVLLNATMAHSLDFDDTHALTKLHTSAPVFPAALTAAEMVGASGDELLAGVIVGLEVMCRLGLAVAQSGFGRGFHMTPVCGAFAATAAAGRVLGLSPDQVCHALGIVLSQAAGSTQFLANGAWTKRFQVGNASASGLMAAVLARAGYTGAGAALEGDRGLFHLYADAADPQAAVAGLGSDWELLKLAFKPYPSCRQMHGALDAVDDLRERYGLVPDAIERVTIGLAPSTLRTVGLPEDKKRGPESTVDGQFSVHFCSAVILGHGRLSWDAYRDYLHDPETRALMQRVHAVEDPRATAMYPQQLAGSATIQTRDGRRLDAFVPIPRGEPDNMLSPRELRVKFDSLVEPYLTSAAQAALFEAIMGLDAGVQVSDLFRWATPSTSGRQTGPPASATA